MKIEMYGGRSSCYNGYHLLTKQIKRKKVILPFSGCNAPPEEVIQAYNHSILQKGMTGK